MGPQLSRGAGRTNTPTVPYLTACKPGMKGEGTAGDFTSAAERPERVGDPPVNAALAVSAAYVQDQSDQLVTKTREFVDLYKAGQDSTPEARVHWERLARCHSATSTPRRSLEPGQDWTGSARASEKDPPAKFAALTDEERATFADDLMANTETLDGRVQKLTYTIDQVANGSRGLLEEEPGKVTGEDRVVGTSRPTSTAPGAPRGLGPIARARTPSSPLLTERFGVQDLLDAQRTDDGLPSTTT